MCLPHMTIVMLQWVLKTLKRLLLSVAKLCPTLCEPMNCSTPGFSVQHYLPEFAQTHANWVSDAPTISSSVIPFSSSSIIPSIRVFSLVSQLFTSGGQSIGASASVLLMNVQGWSPLGLTGWICLESKGLWRVLSSTTVQKQFFSAQPSLCSKSHIRTRLLEKP